MIKEPSVLWITGFSGAGKTTVAKLLQKKIAEKNIKTILLDGDEVREVLGVSSEAFSVDDRKRLAYTYAKFGKLLCQQGFHVIISTISMFEEVRQWNRLNNTHYIEVYLQVLEEERRRRDSKKLYASGQEMVSHSISYEEPKNPDLIFNNSQGFSPEEIAEEIIEFMYKVKIRK